MNGRKWKVFDQNESGTVLYPIHDICLTIMGKICHHNLSQAQDGASFIRIRDYYEAMCRLHLRNTTYPLTVSDEAIEDWGPNPIEYGAYGLEWEHHFYGARDLANGLSWDCEDGWEVCS